MLLQAQWAVLLASTLACVVTTIGIWVISRHESVGRQYSAYFMCFAAGVLISVSFLHIVPKALGMNVSAPYYLLGGFLFTHLSNRFLSGFVCHRTGNTAAAAGLIPMLGIGLHSFIDGIIFAVTFNVSILTGVLAATGMVLHEFPEGIVTFVMLERGGFSRRQSVLYAFLAAAISTPLGTVISLPFVSRISSSALGAMLAFSAGVLIYVGATHLLPAVEKENRRFSLLALLTGILVALGIILSKA